MLRAILLVVSGPARMGVAETVTLVMTTLQEPPQHALLKNVLQASNCRNYDRSNLAFIDIIGTTIVNLGLTIAMVYVRRDELEIVEHLKNMMHNMERWSGRRTSDPFCRS